MAKGTGFVDAVIAALEVILPENGFYTAAGLRVQRGRPEGLEIHAADLPMITVSTNTSGSSSIKPRTNRKDRDIEVIGIVWGESQDYEPLLDSLDEDITRALSALTDMDALPDAMDVQINGGDYTHPEGGSNTASTTYSVIISYALTNHEG